jgi:hypothetical protein
LWLQPVKKPKQNKKVSNIEQHGIALQARHLGDIIFEELE